MYLISQFRMCTYTLEEKFIACAVSELSVIFLASGGPPGFLHEKIFLGAKDRRTLFLLFFRFFGKFLEAKVVLGGGVAPL